MKISKVCIKYKIFDIQNNDITYKYNLTNYKFNSNLEQQIAQFSFHSRTIIPRTEQYTDIHKIFLEHFEESINFKLTFIDFAQIFIDDILVDIVNYKAEII